MSETPDFSDVQKKTMRMVNFEDGLWDMLLGAIFMLLAAYPVSRQLLGPERNFVLFLVLLGLFVGAQITLRQVISTPRIGIAHPRRTIKMRLLLFVVITFVLLTFGLVLTTLLSSSPSVAIRNLNRSYLVEWIVVLVMGGIFSAIGYIYDVKRTYVYGWILGLANLASVYLWHTRGWVFQIPLAAVAAVILLIGVYQLVRFLGKFPVQSEEA